jgi:hypothetical protein
LLLTGFIKTEFADVAELADAHDLGSWFFRTLKSNGIENNCYW